MTGRSLIRQGILALAIFLLLGLSQVRAKDAAGAVLKSLETLDKWLSTSNHGEGWRGFLYLPQLKAEIAKGARANRKAILQTVTQLEQPNAHLQRWRFTQLKSSLQAWLQELDQTQGPDWEPAWQRAIGADVPPATARLAASRQRVSSAILQVESWLNRQPDRAGPWKEYLELSAWRADLGKPKPGSPAELAKRLEFLSGDWAGLERPEILQLRSALAEYVSLAQAANADKPAELYQSQLKALLAAVVRYQQNPTADLAKEIGGTLAFLQHTGWASEWTAALQREYLRPNLFVEASESLVAVGINGPKDDVMPLTEEILGTYISGTGITHGQIEIDFVPNDDHIGLVSVFTGTTRTDTIGLQGPAAATTDGRTEFTGRKELVFDLTGLKGLPASAKCTTNSSIEDVTVNRGGLLGKIIQKAAERRATEKQPYMEYYGARRAEERLAERMDQEASGLQDKVNQFYARYIRTPLDRHDCFPRDVAFSSTEDHLNVSAVVAGPGHIAARSGPPALDSHADLSVQVHESVVHNLGEDFFAGRTLTVDQIRGLIVKFLGKLPEAWERPDDDRSPFSITLRSSMPIEIALNDNEVQLKIHGERYTSGDREFDAMDIIIRYRVTLESSGLVAKRVGDLQILPPGFDPTKQRRIPFNKLPLRRRMQTLLSRIFKEEFRGQGLTLPGKWANAGKLRMTQLESQNGWLVLSVSKP